MQVLVHLNAKRKCSCLSKNVSFIFSQALIYMELRKYGITKPPIWYSKPKSTNQYFTPPLVLVLIILSTDNFTASLKRLTSILFLNFDKPNAHHALHTTKFSVTLYWHNIQ